MQRFLVSWPIVVWDLRIWVRTRHFFSETIHYIFLKLYRACKREKKFPSTFLIIFNVLATNDQKWSRKKWRFHFFRKISKIALFDQNLPKFGQNYQKWRFSHFFWDRRIRISYFFHSKYSLWSWKKWHFHFLQKFQKWPILAKIDPNLAKMNKNGGFPPFLRTTHQNFLILCSKRSLWSQKNFFLLFLKNLKNGPFCNPNLA